jgi:hypothetical protein
MVRSEGIRSVKLALEAAGLDMPEPTYRLQWAGTQSGLAPAVTSPPQVDDVASPDTRARSDLEEQIARDQQQSDSTNLLDQSAPRE